DPICAADTIEIAIEAADGDRLDRDGCKKGVGLEGARTIESLARDVGREVEQDGRDAGVCEERRNLGGHRAGAEHGGGSYLLSHRAFAPLTNRSTTASA